MEIPNWLKIKIKAKIFECPHCHKVMQFNSITGMGVKESIQDSGIAVLFVEYNCKSCKKTLLFELFPMTLDIMVENTIEEWSMDDVSNGFSKKNRNSNKKRSKISKIDKEEFQDALKIINNSSSWYDMMLDFGSTEKQIEQYEAYGKKIDQKLET